MGGWGGRGAARELLDDKGGKEIQREGRTVSGPRETQAKANKKRQQQKGARKRRAGEKKAPEGECERKALATQRARGRGGRIALRREERRSGRERERERAKEGRQPEGPAAEAFPRVRTWILVRRILRGPTFFSPRYSLTSASLKAMSVTP